MYLKRTSTVKTYLSAEQTKQIKEVVNLNSNTEEILRILGYSNKQVDDILICLKCGFDYISLSEEQTEYLAGNYEEWWWSNNKDEIMEFESGYVYEFVEE